MKPVHLVVLGLAVLAAPVIAQTQGATINNLTLDGARITASGQSVACIAADAQSSNIHHITVENSTIVSTYGAGAGLSYTGGIVGNYLADAANNPLQNITIDKLSISNSLTLSGYAGFGYVGGVVGHIPVSTTVTIDIPVA